MRDLISHAEGDGLITGNMEAELVECVHDVFEIRPGDFGDFELCRPIKGWSIPAGAGSAAGSDHLPGCAESVEISEVAGGPESIPASTEPNVGSTDEHSPPQ
jgi:hypothetical protein